MRRLNVAITRAKHFLFVVGNSSTLKGDILWDNMVIECKKVRSGYFVHEKEINNYSEILDHLTKAYDLQAEIK